MDDEDMRGRGTGIGPGGSEGPGGGVDDWGRCSLDEAREDEDSGRL